jgi:hypothetical protein
MIPASNKIVYWPRYWWRNVEWLPEEKINFFFLLQNFKISNLQFNIGIFWKICAHKWLCKCLLCFQFISFLFLAAWKIILISVTDKGYVIQSKLQCQIFKRLLRKNIRSQVCSPSEHECKILGFNGGDYEECRLLGHTNPVHTSQEKYYISATKSSLLMLCKIWGFYCGDYEECRPPGIKNPVHTSQETNYISVTEPSLLMLCTIWGFTVVTLMIIVLF